MKKLTISITDEKVFLNKELHPKSIENEIPNWYKNMKPNKKIDSKYPLYERIKRKKNIKTCPSFNTIYKKGYVIYAPIDYYIRFDEEGSLYWETPMLTDNLVYKKDQVDMHSHDQFLDHLPKNNWIGNMCKLQLPYRIHTPIGYSVAYSNIPYDFDRKFKVLYGIQDTNLSHPLNLHISIDKNIKELYIQQGEPLCLITPIKNKILPIKITDYNSNNKFKNKELMNQIKLFGKFKNGFYKNIKKYY